ncbi:MAG: hypothetical protein ABDH20_09740, partial [Thermus sp.]
MEQGKLVGVVISPKTLLLLPGEERVLGAWVVDEEGRRYAADPSYLDLKVYNPDGYQVAWVGPGRIRVKAPEAFRDGMLVLNVRRRDMEGKEYLNALATVSMVEVKPGVQVVPEEVLGLPVSYELDEATTLARLNLFPIGEWLRAFFDPPEGSEERPRFGVVVRGGSNAPQWESLVGRWVFFPGEGGIYGRVREVVGRRGEYVLLSLEFAWPWEVFERYQRSVDFDAVFSESTGVLPFDGADLLGEPEEQGGIAPQSAAQNQGGGLKEYCERNDGRYQRELKLDSGSLVLKVACKQKKGPFEREIAFQTKVDTKLSGGLDLFRNVAFKLEPKVKLGLSGSLSLTGRPPESEILAFLYRGKLLAIPVLQTPMAVVFFELTIGPTLIDSLKHNTSKGGFSAKYVDSKVSIDVSAALELDTSKPRKFSADLGDPRYSLSARFPLASYDLNGQMASKQIDRKFSLTAG